MAERASGQEKSGKSQTKGSSSGGEEISGREAVEEARTQLAELMGRPVESVSGMEREEDGGGWMITVQVVELSRIPTSTDVLGSYAVRVDANGEVVGYERTRRYRRNQADEG
jgi:hypothetical protein